MTTVSELAATTKFPVDFVFSALSTTGSLEADLIPVAAANQIKAGSVTNALKALVGVGLVETRNASTGKRGRPPKMFYRAGEAPALPVKTESAPVPPATDLANAVPSEAPVTPPSDFDLAQVVGG